MTEAELGGICAGASVRDLATAAGRRLAVLRHLPRSRRTWGREVVGAQALASLFPLQPA